MFVNFFEVNIDPKHTYIDDELQTILNNSNQFRVRMIGGHALCELNFFANNESIERILRSDIRNAIGTVWNLKIVDGKFKVWIRALNRSYNIYLHQGSATVRLIGERDSDGRIIPEKTKIVAFDIQCPKKATT